jgi:hypothetical protein
LPGRQGEEAVFSATHQVKRWINSYSMVRLTSPIIHAQEGHIRVFNGFTITVSTNGLITMRTQRSDPEVMAKYGPALIVHTKKRNL